MSTKVKRIKTLSQNNEIGSVREYKNRTDTVGNKGGIVSESFLLGDITTMPLIYLGGEIQQREFYKPGLSMEAINILEECDPAVIKKYLSGFLDLPTNLLNAGSAQNKDESICIGLDSQTLPRDTNIDSDKASWCVREVMVSPPGVVYDSRTKEKDTRSIKVDSDVSAVTKVSAATMPSEVVAKSYSSLDGLIDEFSFELEKKLKEKNHSTEVLPEEDENLEAALQSFKEEQEGVGVEEPEYVIRDEPEIVRTHVTDSDDTCVVKDVFLIYSNGTLIFHARRKSDADIGDDIFRVMLTAVKDFIKDTIKMGGGGGLKRMDFGMHKILIEHGRNVCLTTVLLGSEPLYLPLYMMEVVNDVEEKYGSIFEGWDGNFAQLYGIDKSVEKLLGVTYGMNDDIEGFESGTVASTLKLLERANKIGIGPSSPEIFAQNVTKAIEREGFRNAWDYLKRTEHELTKCLYEKGEEGAEKGGAESEIGMAGSQVTSESDATDYEIEAEKAELEDTISTFIELMDELDSEKRGTEEERAKLREMIKDIEDKIIDYGDGAEGKEGDRIEFIGIIKAVEEKINELKMESIDIELEKVELEGAIKGIEDKMTELEISQIGTDAERNELKRMMDGIENKIVEMENENIETEVAKAELKRMMDSLQEKISALESEKKETKETKAKTEGIMKEMETKMAELEIKIQGTEEKMEELKGEIEVKRFTIEYIQSLEDKGELETLCEEVGLSFSGTKMELKNRLIRYLEGTENDVEQQGEVKDKRFTRENIESISTKAELVALCEEAGLKKSGKKEEIRSRLLKYVEDRESEAKKADNIGVVYPFKIEGADKLTYAVLGDMYKHIAMELGDNVDAYVKDLEGFIRSILEVREEMGAKSDESLKSIIIKPYNDKTGEVLNKLKTPFLNKVNAENLEVVEPGKEWEGIKLNMEINKDLIATTFPTQATKISMLLRLQSPQKIKQVFEEKGEYTLGVEGYPVTIVPDMLNFRIVIPENIEIKELEGGIVYIDKEVIRNIDTEEEPPPPPEYEEEDIVTTEPKPPRYIPEPPEPIEPTAPTRHIEPLDEPPPPPDNDPKPKSLKKAKGKFIKKLKWRRKK